MAEENENGRSEAAKREEAVLAFWKREKIFHKSLEKKSSKGDFVFYEGPPTANGKPGIHHLEARAFKDSIPRYKTMRGYHVRRKGGWDTHGLPVELQVEKKLGLNSKKGIEEYGIAKFNEECKKSVWEYVDLWERFTERIGYWVDQKEAYVTYHNSYIESLWNIVKKVNEQGLLYKDYKVVPWCPRCGTALSSHELAQGYEDVKDLSVYVKFKVKGEDNTYILAWTTTSWTLPGNVALAVGGDIAYVKIKVGEEKMILSKERLSVIEIEYSLLEECLGKDLVGMEYEPLYPYFADTISEKEKEKMDKAYKVYSANFVTTEDGTGVVHTAVMYGQDDFVLGSEVGLPKHHLVGLDGRFLAGTGFLEGRFVRDEEVAVDIIKDLAHRNLLLKKEKYAHTYPHCWRCHTALIYYARDSWYIKMSDPKVKEKMLKENEKISWEPAHIKNGRFGEWLREIKDWAISRERYWGTPLPVWFCDSCKQMKVIGSLEELKERSGGKLPENGRGELDLHRPYIDDIRLSCECGGRLERVKEVMDVWFDSGGMPFAQDHYPFSVREIAYPADFISEAIDQTRGWFYTLHAVGTLMGRGAAYKNVICLGHLLDKDGRKMSKHIGNVVDPWEMIEKYGSDTLRLWMYSVNQPGESKNFDEKTVLMLHRQVFGLLYNVLSFYELYKDEEIGESGDSKNILDRWILARFDELVSLSTDNLEKYKLLEPVRNMRDFIDDLSTWYLRRSRDRIKEGDKEAKATLYSVLKNLARLMAPFAPFSSEDIWMRLRKEDDPESVHLAKWPETKKHVFGFLSKKDPILENMKNTRETVRRGLEARQKAGIKVRQPLGRLEIEDKNLPEEYLSLIKDELNVKEITIGGEFLLDTAITPELKDEGYYRELVRGIQDMRKAMGLVPHDMVKLTISDSSGLAKKFEADLMKSVSAKAIEVRENDGEEVKVDDISFRVIIEK